MTVTTYLDLETLTDEWMIRDDTGEDDLLEACLEAASRRIDAICGRRFYLDDTATAREFRVTNGSVFVDDIGSTSGLIVKEDSAGDGTYATTLTSAAYYLEPAGTGRPYTELKRGSGYWITSNYNRPTVQVTARWGWPSVPTAVQFATRIATQALYKRKDAPAPGGMFGSPELGVFRVSSFDQDIYGLLAPYRRLVIA